MGSGEKMLLNIENKFQAVVNFTHYALGKHTYLFG